MAGEKRIFRSRDFRTFPTVSHQVANVVGVPVAAITMTESGVIKWLLYSFATPFEVNISVITAQQSEIRTACVTSEWWVGSAPLILFFSRFRLSHFTFCYLPMFGCPLLMYYFLLPGFPLVVVVVKQLGYCIPNPLLSNFQKSYSNESKFIEVSYIPRYCGIRSNMIIAPTPQPCLLSSSLWPGNPSWVVPPHSDQLWQAVRWDGLWMFYRK